jgi:hypothetical protein
MVQTSSTKLYTGIMEIYSMVLIAVVPQLLLALAKVYVYS